MISRPSHAAALFALAATALRLLAACSGGTEGPSVFVAPAQDAGDDATVVVSPPLATGDGAPPPPLGPTSLPAAGPPVGAPVCNASVTKESCQPDESSFPVPSTIRVAPDGDGGCRQAIYAETRDGGAFACIIGTDTECYGPMTLGTSYPFALSHSETSGIVSATFGVRFDGNGNVPSTVSISGCFQ